MTIICTDYRHSPNIRKSPPPSTINTPSLLHTAISLVVALKRPPCISSLQHGYGKSSVTLNMRAKTTSFHCKHPKSTTTVHTSWRSPPTSVSAGAYLFIYLFVYYLFVCFTENKNNSTTVNKHDKRQTHWTKNSRAT